MTELALPDKIVAVDAALDGVGIEHAFGGALALAYYAEPRVTIDVDVNVFVPSARFGDLDAALRPLGVDTAVDVASMEQHGQCRMWWQRTPLDVFFATHPLHEAMRRSRRPVPFGELQIPILSAELLTVCKVLFDRPKDWIDIEQVVLTNPAIDAPEIERWLSELVGEDDPRTLRLRRVFAEALGGEEG